MTSHTTWRRTGCPHHRGPGILPGFKSLHSISLHPTLSRLRSGWLSLLLGSLLVPTAALAEPFAGKPYTDGDLHADTWVATDGLGRKQPGIAEAGPVKKDKWVGIFYWTWHHQEGANKPFDNTKLIAAAKDGRIEWPSAVGNSHYWGEPELGYYLSTDPFVIRKHASMLVDAGVDVLLFDTTNPPFTFKDAYEALCRTYTEMRAEGNRTPAVGFICPFGNPQPVLDQLWKDLYKPGLWSDLWFRWDGKPLILANPAVVKDPQMLAFFTFRNPMPDYWRGPSGVNQWSWLEVFPQHVFKNDRGEAEQMSVGVAQNALPNTPGPAAMSDKRGAMGRSWHNGARDTRQNATAMGLNFDEQWRRAMEINPKFVFLTGWNEWVAGRYTNWSRYSDQNAYFKGGLFVDEYDQEYSRDCEPMLGGHTDDYYYQMAAWVRRYKGLRPMPTAAGPAAITIDGRFDDWAAVAPEYRDTIGDVAHRKHPGRGDQVYENNSGRNDFVIMKATYDVKNLYFMAQTREPITPHIDPKWMLLLLDTDQNAATGWMGYDYIVNLEVIDNDTSTLKCWKNGGWQPAGRISYQVSGNGMELAVPRELIGKAGGEPAFDFHWADNTGGFQGIDDFGVNGDSAPNRRWNYRFEVK